MDIDELYKKATGEFTPYPYQRRLATEPEFPQLLSVPTGVGKTAAVILSWIYRRRFAEEAIRRRIPRRLVYCLPMRTLVEQTRTAAEKWLQSLELNKEERGSIAVHELMGGSDDGRWYESPEQDVILIGTQDMLLSRALNRGYGMSRYLWPMHYALLNNDSLWILDETQLMGVGLVTSAQLQGLREKLNVFGNCQTLWMSATLDPEPIRTVDHPVPENDWKTEALNDEDFESDAVRKLVSARKPLQTSDLILTSNSKEYGQYPAHLAEHVLEKHQKGTLTLVVLNRVERAQLVYEELQERLHDKSQIDLHLIHSRFRPHDRQVNERDAFREASETAGGRILIATQAIEAGVDLSATTLFTELAPWSSLVQRFGRCNRRGLCGEGGAPSAAVHWIDVETSPSKSKTNALLPYSGEELDSARELLRPLADVGPESLKELQVDEPDDEVHVLRRKDLMELFDTTPDLSGNDLDVSRYIRDTDDTDVQVYWRHWDVEASPKQNGWKPPDDDVAAPIREELCSVSVTQFNTFLSALNKKEKTKSPAWVWNPLDGQWERCQSSRPGQTILLHTSTGGYASDLGWTGDMQNSPVADLSEELISLQQRRPQDAMDREEPGAALTLQDHLRDVGQMAEKMRDDVTAEWDESVPWREIVQAAWWHDVGKAHPAFQQALRDANDQLAEGKLWAKSGESKVRFLTYVDEDENRRRGFRHELASALAWFQQRDGEAETDLVAYLLAAHHGKVRLSIRSMPNEVKPSDGRLFARGVWQNDPLPEVALGNGETSRELQLDLSPMKLGESVDENGNAHPSWLSRMIALRDEYGPFRLSYLETLVRIADWRGSRAGGNS